MRNFIWFVVLFCLLNPVSLSFGESHGFCDEFANAALLQYKEAKALGMNTPFPVWSDNYNHHYSWCRTQSMQPVEQGHALRQAQIEQYKNNINPVPKKKGFAAPEVISSGYKTIPSKLAKASIQVKQISVASGKKYTTSVPVRAGNKVFIDRNFNYTNIPVELIKGVGIVTSNNDKFSAGDRPFLTFTIDRPGIVYVAYDRRYKSLPVWLRSFQKMKKSIVYNVSGGNVVGDLYKKHFPKGRVELGGNIPVGSRENLSMYTVFVVAAKVGMANEGRKTPRMTLINQVMDRKNKFDVMIANELSNYNQRLDQAIRNNVAMQKKINTHEFKTLQSPEQIAAYLLASIPNDGKPYPLNLKDFEALPRKKGESIRLQRKKKSNTSIAVMQQLPKGLLSPLKPMNMSNIPVDGLAQIVSFPGTDALEPGDWVYISGIGFGNSPGTILLEYTVNIDEFGKEWINHALVISPGTHNLVWRDNIIVFRLPDTLPNINSTDLGKGQGIGKAALTLKLNTGKKIIRQVKLEVDKTAVIDIWTSSSIDVTYYMPKADDHWEKFKNSYTKDEFYTRMPDKMALDNIGVEYRSIEPGSEVIIIGSGFLDTPGQVEILVGNNKVPIIPVENDWWNNYSIRFKVGNIPGHVSRDIGILTIRTSSGKIISNIAAFTFVYGPEMTVKVVSGNKWFEPEWDEDSSYAEPDKNNLVLFVSHDPGCGWFKTSESGWDFFFRNKKLPRGVLLKHFTFIEIDHENANDQLNFLKNYLTDILSSLEGFGFLDIALGFITKPFKLMIQSTIDYFFGDGGGYSAYMPSLPKANIDSPTIGVMWENSCTGPNSGLPIMYVTTFVITGPRIVLDKM